MNGTNFLVLGPLGGAKRSSIIKFQLLSQFQIFLNQTLCVFRWDFLFSRLGDAPGV